MGTAIATKTTPVVNTTTYILDSLSIVQASLTFIKIIREEADNATEGTDTMSGFVIKGVS